MLVSRRRLAPVGLYHAVVVPRQGVVLVVPRSPGGAVRGDHLIGRGGVGARVARDEVGEPVAVPVAEHHAGRRGSAAITPQVHGDREHGLAGRRDRASRAGGRRDRSRRQRPGGGEVPRLGRPAPSRLPRSRRRGSLPPTRRRPAAALAAVRMARRVRARSRRARSDSAIRELTCSQSAAGRNALGPSAGFRWRTGRRLGTLDAPWADTRAEGRHTKST